MRHLHPALLIVLASLAACGWAAEADNDDDLVIVPRPQETSRNYDKLKIQLNSQDIEKARAAAALLVAARDPATAPIFWELYRNCDGLRRLLAVNCAGKPGQKGDADKLYRIALQDYSMTVRLAAAQALARLETAAQACARFKATLADEKKVPLLNRVRALQALAWCGGRDVAGELRAWFNSKETELAVAAAEGLSALGAPAAAGLFIKALAEGDEELKSEAVEDLERLTGKNFGRDLVQWNKWAEEAQAVTERPGPAAGAPPQTPSGGFTLLEAQPPSAERAVDLVLLYDTTGSMGTVWSEVGLAVDALLAEIIKQNPSVRIGTVKYRASQWVDEGGIQCVNITQYIVASEPFTRQYEKRRKEIHATAFGGGSGAVYDGLCQAVMGMPWRVHARKIIILLGDITPAGPGQILVPKLIKEMWQADGMLVDSLYVHTLHGDNFNVYRNLALAGGGRFFEFDRNFKRFLDNTAEKADARKAEPISSLAAKMFMPRE